MRIIVAAYVIVTMLDLTMGLFFWALAIGAARTGEPVWAFVNSCMCIWFAKHLVFRPTPWSLKK